MITIRLPQPGSMGWQPGKGRRWSAFRASDVIAIDAPGPDIRYWNASNWWGDQGYTSECTIYSWLHVLHDGPITHKRVSKPMDSPTRLYQLGQDHDGTPRTDMDSGLTSDAAAWVMLSEGYIGEYRWATHLDEVVECVRKAGPGTLGSWWPQGMDDPDERGFVKYEGTMRGGHQYKIDGVNTRKKFFRFKNSWGRAWGRKGFAYMTFDTMRAILNDGGEFCIARELLNRAPQL